MIWRIRCTPSRPSNFGMRLSLISLFGRTKLSPSTPHVDGACSRILAPTLSARTQGAPLFARVLHPCLPPLLRQYVVEHPPRFGRSHLRGSRTTIAVAATGKATGKLQPRLWVVPLFVWPCYITPEEHSLEPGKHLKSHF